VSADDPRTSADFAGESDFDAGTDLYPPNKYASYTAPEVIADGVEARLIEAEAALASNYAGANGTLAILNALRAGAGLTPLAPAATAAAQQNQLFRERAFWMYGTAHRLGDLRRLVRQYGRAATSVFPTGDYFKGGEYGDDVSMPVPQEEENNPNFSRAACNPAQP
jgi:starch-binding outer membrane protein, SusD/RagB family